MRIEEKDTFIHYVLLAIVCGLIMATTSGCALMNDGTELVLKAGIYGVSEKQESQRLARNPKPYICYMFPSRCQSQPTADEANGS
jgi:predicted cobalt transporter CbtA